MVQVSAVLRSFAAEDPGGWDGMVRTARLLDEAGVDRLVVSDHVVMGEHLDAYGRPELGGQEGGRQPTGPDGHWLEPLTTLTYLAALTDRIRLGTNVLLATLRRPAVLAKTTATLDVLSGGRLDLGVGVGWQREEYDAAGLAFEDRGHLLDQTLEVCRLLWTEPVAALASAGIDADGIHMMPKPIQPGGVPVWVGGTVNPRSVRRVARFGSGWIPWGADARDPAEAIPRMRRALTDAGADPDGLQVVGALRHRRADDGRPDLDAIAEPVPALVAAGVTDLRWVGPIPDEDEQALDQLGALVEAVRRAAA